MSTNSIMDQINNFAAIAAAAAAAASSNKLNNDINHFNNNNNRNNNNSNQPMQQQQPPVNPFFPPFGNYPGAAAGINPLNDIENLKDRAYLEQFNNLTSQFNHSNNQAYDLSFLNKMKEAIASASGGGGILPTQTNNNNNAFSHPSQAPFQFIYNNLLKQTKT